MKFGVFEALKLLGAALAGEAIINQRYADFTDLQYHHAKLGVAMLALGFGPELVEGFQDGTFDSDA
jgi:hypothetical protein